MSPQVPQPVRFPQLYALARTFFQELLTLVRARFGDPPRWPTADFYDIQYNEGSAQYRSFSTPVTKKEYPAAALH